MADDSTSVRVALRIRPQSAQERISMCQVCTSVSPHEPQVFIGKDKAFTYDFVFNTDSQQHAIYLDLAKPLIDGCLEGYNATIFAYGQTGSGKTYTMGTGFDLNCTPDEIGIIPRAVEYLFNGINDLQQNAKQNDLPPPDFKVNAQFMELYNEEILDLLDTTRDPSDKTHKSHIKIHEDAAGGIYTIGVTTRAVTSLQDTIQCLKIGALSRTTASTNMNAQSSRSHAIFTLHIKQQRVVRAEDDDEKNNDNSQKEATNEFETLTAKFHFVDLAGSERLKRTGATGDRQKEGISINCGLLALGNVISALGDRSKRGCHVPYRDSKLTRLLQDSLGGNSRTVMIACVSPSDRDFMETLNTLKYANRARNIQNKVVVNQDKTSRQLAELRLQVQILQNELMEYKTGKRLVDVDGVETVNDMFHENTMLQTENNNLRQRIKAMQETVETMTTRNVELLAEHAALNIGNMNGEVGDDEVAQLIKGYIQEIEELRSKLVESEALVETLKRASSRASSRFGPSAVMHTGGPMSVSLDSSGLAPLDSQLSSILEVAKKDVRKMKKRTQRLSQSSDKDNLSEDEKQDHEECERDVSSKEREDAGSDEGDNEEEDEDAEAEEDMSSDSDSEEDSDEEVYEGENLHEDLADLTCEISIKEKLIEELENSQKRLHAMRVQYEEKLVLLQARIRNTEVERDQVLTNMGSIESHSQDKSKKVKDEYEKKLSSMQSELKKLQAAKREHAKLLRNQSQYENQLRTLQRDLGEMKRVKVKLMKQIKDEATKNRNLEAQRNREMAKIKKEQRQKDNQIRNLTQDKSRKEAVLRRKQEEVEALRRKQKNMSAKTAGRVAKYDKPVTEPMGLRRRKPFSPKAAKQKWDNLEKTVSSVIMKKQTMCHMEQDMERWLKQRISLSRKLDKFERKKQRAETEGKPDEVIQDLNEQIETLRDNVVYVQENINECQSSIVQMEENKDAELEPASVCEGVSNLEEAKYLLEHFISLAISKGLFASQKDSENKELLAKLHQERMDSTFQRDMLQYLIQDKVDIEIDDSLIREREDSDVDSISSSGSASPVDRMLDGSTMHPLTAAMMHPVPSTAAGDAVNNALLMRTKDKARRKTATPEDLLYAGNNPSNGPSPAGGVAMRSVPETPEDDPRRVNGAVPDAYLMPPPSAKLPTRTNGVARVSSAPSTREPTPSPSMMRKSYPPPPRGHPVERSPSMRRKVTGSASSLSRQSSVSSKDTNSDTTDFTPPSSPNPNRRSFNREDPNVFSRLTSGSQSYSPHPNRGMINPHGGTQRTKTSPLLHSHTADGHTKAVLSVFATEDLLFSSSKDRTAKIWDLATGQEVLTLGSHPNNVISVKYSEDTKLVYTVSTYFIKVWDVREGQKCIKSLTSSGLTNDGVLNVSSSSRQVTCPPGETNINDIALNSTGSVLYSAAGNTVKIWDLRSFKAIGKLSGGHQAAVMVLAVDDTDTADGNICVVTGSKDHYIKVFEVMEDSAGLLTPKCNLEPPHYDGIQSLCLMGDLLFSGSRDTCIKKWDLAEQTLNHSISNAHKDWICGLSFMPGGNALLSGCRGGFLKIWHIDTCQQLGEIRAHISPINAITTNSRLIFTASNEGGIKIWEPSWEQMPDNVQEFFI